MIKMMNRITSTAMLAVAFILCATSAWAEDKENPVTGETETYSNIFTGGTSSEWNLADNWTLANESKVPFVSSGDYNAALVDGKTATSSSTAIDGWQLRVGAYNGATVTWSSGITKIQASNTGCWFTADETSSITIASFANKQLEGSDTYPFKLSSANAGGITWSAGLTGANNTSLPFWYYLKGTGTVVYGGDITVANAQVIKQADVSLSGSSKSIENKDLVTFGSGTTKAFTADASVSIKQSNVAKTTRTLKSVTAGGEPVKLASDTDWQVGTCELVQTSTGVKLYYVDGDYDTSYMAYIGDDPSANRHLSVADALAAIAADDTLPKKITLLLNTEEDIVIPSVGFVFDSNGKTIAGTISGASGVGLSESAGVYTGISNTAATWTGTAGDGLWENAQNWSTKSVPTSSTTVTFNDDAIVNTPYDSAVAYGIVISEGHTLTLRRAGETPGTAWSTITVGAGAVSGNGTLKLVASGIRKSVSSFTINANLEFENDGTHDSFLEEQTSGSFTITGTVTGTGYFNAKTSTTFNGDVTLGSNSKLYCAWTPVFSASLIAGENSTISFQDGSYRNQTFNGAVTLGAGSTLTPTSGTCPTFGNSSSLNGSGTFVLNGFDASEKIKSHLQNSSKWAGICELRSLTISDIDFADYGNENSYVGANGLSGTFKGSSGVCRVADGIKGLKLTGTGLTVGGWSTGHTYVIAADISGAGPINLNIQSNAGNPLNAPASIDKVVFTGSTSDFTGQVSFKQSSYRPCYIFANESDLDSLPTPTDYGQIIVMAGKTVNVGSVWTAAGGFLINGEADTKSSSAYLSGTVLGNGTVKAAYTHSSDALRAPDFGNASENTFEITGMTGGWISNAGANGMPNIKATVKLSGNVTINNGYGANNTTANVTTFKRLAGSGNLNFSFNTGSAYANYTISTINGAINVDNPYTGTITANNKARVVIGVVDVDEVPLDGRRLVGIANSNRDRFVNASGTAINDNGLIDVTVGGAADTAKLYADTDGLYVAIAQVGDTYYKSLRAAADAARAADTTFTRVYAGAGDTYPGWTYSDGVFTYDNKVAYNATKDVAYATLQDAITASSAEDIIQLLEANSETAVDTTDKDFFFDENGYAFGGTWTGSGRIVLSKAPSATTWSSAKFVNEGWTGTVALDWENIVSANDLPTQFNKYGISVSTVEIGANGSASGYLNSTPNPNLKVTGFLEVKNGSKDSERTIRYITGSGVLLVTHFYNNNGETTHYKITTLDNWSGVITNTSEKLTITTISGGSGVIHTSAAFKVDPTTIDSSWQGRVVLDYANIVTVDTDVGAKINAYGVSGSTVEIGENGTARGYANADVSPNLEINGSLEMKNGSRNTERTISYVSGRGQLTFTHVHNNGGETTNYKITALDNWTGIVSNNSTSVKITTIASGSGAIWLDEYLEEVPTTINDAWSGTVVINKSTSSGTAIKIGGYGNSNSKIVINQNSTGYLSNAAGNGNANFAGTLEISENVTLAIDNAWTGSNVTIGSLTGKGNLTVANTTHRWTGTVGYNIGTIDADAFTGTLTIGNEYNIGISKITRSTEPAYGTPYVKAAKTHADLESSTDGYFDVGSTTVEINGVTTDIRVAYGTISEQTGIYKAIADVNSTTYYATVQDAINASTSGDTVTLLSDTTEDLTVKGGTRLVLNGHTISGTVAPPNTTEYTLSFDEGVYSIANRTVTYYWIADTGNWVTPANWAVNSVDGAVATRVPTSIDSVVLTSADTSMISLPAEAVSVSAVTVNAGTCALMGSFTSLALGTVTAVDGVLYVATPQSVVPTYTLGQFTKVTVGGTEMAPAYTFSLRPGTIFSVY